jgi:hypothetical protein
MHATALAAATAGRLDMAGDTAFVFRSAPGRVRGKGQARDGKSRTGQAGGMVMIRPADRFRGATVLSDVR